MKIALIGYGKMGKAIEEAASEKNKAAGEILFDIVHRFDISNQDEFTVDNLRNIDVAIEFTTPDTALLNIYKCFEAGTPIIVGTTGWTSKLVEVKEYALNNNKSFLFAPNYSVGVNIFFEMNRYLARIMDKYEEYDVTLEEIHHTEKKDAPSGTGLFAALDILSILRRKKDWVNEASNVASTLSIRSLRESNVPGTHTINYKSTIDEIEIKHTAHSRKGFATGALLAAEWIKDKKGAFSMDDVLGFNQ